MKYIDAERLKAETEKRMHICDGIFERDSDTYYQGKAVAYQETLSLIDSLQQEQPSLPDNLDEAAKEYMKKARKHLFDDSPIGRADDAFKAGAEWASPRWISVNEKLPPEDEEVIVLTNEANGHTLPIACHLCFAHIVSDKTMFVDYNGWNIPQVKYWMPCPELPEK